jgi:hypothetical protein
MPGLPSKTLSRYSALSGNAQSLTSLSACPIRWSVRDITPGSTTTTMELRLLPSFESCVSIRHLQIKAGGFCVRRQTLESVFVVK